MNEINIANDMHEADESEHETQILVKLEEVKMKRKREREWVKKKIQC